jgi:hypothetical protein
MDTLKYYIFVVLYGISDAFTYTMDRLAASGYFWGISFCIALLCSFATNNPIIAVPLHLATFISFFMLLDVDKERDGKV